MRLRRVRSCIRMLRPHRDPGHRPAPATVSAQRVVAAGDKPHGAVDVAGETAVLPQQSRGVAFAHRTSGTSTLERLFIAAPIKEGTMRPMKWLPIVARVGNAGVQRERRRNVQFAVHVEADQGAGGVRPRLDPWRRGAGGRLRQARDDRRRSEIEGLRQGRQQCLRRCTWRSPSHGIHRRPPLPVGRGAEQQPDLRVRCRHQSCEAEAREDDQ